MRENTPGSEAQGCDARMAGLPVRALRVASVVPSMSLVSRRRSSRRRSAVDLLLLGFVLLIAAAFRLHGLDFDQGTHQHPDERFLTDVASRVAWPPSLGAYFDTSSSSLNPYAQGFKNYAYGQLPLTLTRLAAERVGRTGFDAVYLVGRSLSVASDLGTILFAWLLASRVFGVRQAHLTAVLLAVTVLPIQLAHFFAVDTFVACFAAASLYWGQRAWQRDSLLDAALAGSMIGLATASKISALILLPVVCLALLWPRDRRLSRDWLLDRLAGAGVVLLAAVLVFRVTEPYAFVGPTVWGMRPNVQWIADKAYFAEVSSGTIDVPYMIQWVGTSAYGFVLRAVVQWGMGPALGLTSLTGLAVLLWRLLRGARAEREAILVVAWTVINLAYFGGQFAKFLRYLIPAYFGLAMLAAYVLVLLADAARARRSSVARVGATALAVVVVAATGAWALAFSGIYDVPHSRVQASQWIYANIATGKTLAVEHWDDRLPLGLAGGDERRYRYQELKLYDPETPQKRDELIQLLDRTDYVILASRRLADSIPRLPERYPLATTYYRLLAGGQLGFERVAYVRVLPHLGPLAIDDSGAQEDFTVYDHPAVEIWAKRADYSPAAVRQLLGAVAIDRAVNVRAADGGKGTLLLAPAEAAAAMAGGTWSALFQRTSLVNSLPLPVWLAAAELVALAAVPLLWATLRMLPDRGFAAAKIVGLALVCYVPWLLASLKLAPFGRTTLLLAWLLLAASSVAVVWRQRRDFLVWLRREARLLGTIEAVFLVGFGVGLGLRLANPDLWHPTFGGEKPMNFAYLNAVVKSDYFPPYDPWFAGGIINYYYYGFVLVAALIKATGILPEIAFNLAQPTIFGALCAGCFSLAFAMTAPLRARARRWASYLAGGAAVCLTCLLGNLDAGLQVVDRLGRLGAAEVPASGAVTRVLAGLRAVAASAPIGPLDFWRSTRFIGPEDAGPIHEFPYFTFLYGDLHAHQIALPLTVATLLVALDTARRARAAPGRVPWPGLVWAGLLVGMLRATNTWDFPTYAAIVLFALVLGFAHGLLRARRESIQAFVVSVALFGLLSQLSFWPYLQRYQLFYTGVDPVKARTALSQYLTIHGLFLFLGGSLLLWELVRAQRGAQAARRARGLLPEPGFYGVVLPLGASGAVGWSPSSAAAWAALAGVAAALAFLLAGYPTRGLITVGVGGGVALWLAHWRRPDRAFQGALLVGGLLATLIPEFVALKGDVGRMNTVFKFYLQAWIMLAAAGAVAVAWLARRAGRDPVVRAARLPWLAAAAVLAGAALAYPLFATEGKVGLRFADLPRTLDGMAYMDHADYRDQDQDLGLPADAAAIRWLQDTVVGSPTILEGRSPVYRWGSRVSVYTGLPTVLGWDVHQVQQRAGYVAQLQERATDVQRAYASPDPADALAVIRRYGVRWVYVGGLERAYYPGPGLDKLRAMPELRLAYDRDGVQIFEVPS